MKTKGMIWGAGLVIFALAASALGQAAVRSAGGSQRGGGVGVAPTRNDDRSAGRLRVGDRLVVTKNLPRERLEAHYGPSDRNITRTNGVFVEIPEGTVVEVFSTPRRGGTLEVVPVRMGELTRPGDLRRHFVPARFVTHDFRHYTIQVDMGYLGAKLVPEDGVGRGGVAVAPAPQTPSSETFTEPSQLTPRYTGVWRNDRQPFHTIYEFREDGTFVMELFDPGVVGEYPGTWSVDNGTLVAVRPQCCGGDGYDTTKFWYDGEFAVQDMILTGSDGGAWRWTNAEERAKLAKNANTARELMYESSPSSETYTDPRDNQTYRTERIGNSTWLAQNLNHQTANSWCYGNADSNCVKYGRLYNWDAAMTACPAGWRLPTGVDWDDLIAAAGGDAAPRRLRYKTGWLDEGGYPVAINSTDDLGFSAMPGGSRISNANGRFFAALGMTGYFWISREAGAGEAQFIGIGSADEPAGRHSSGKGNAFSVRCVTD